MKKKTAGGSFLGVEDVNGSSRKGESSRGDSVSPARSASPSKSRGNEKEGSESVRADRSLNVLQGGAGNTTSPGISKPQIAPWMHANHKKRLKKNDEEDKAEKLARSEVARSEIARSNKGQVVEESVEDLQIDNLPGQMDSPSPPPLQAQVQTKAPTKDSVKATAKVVTKSKSQAKVQEETEEETQDGASILTVDKPPPSRQPGTKTSPKKVQSVSEQEKSKLMQEDIVEAVEPDRRQTRAAVAAVEKEAPMESTPLKKVSNVNRRGAEEYSTKVKGTRSEAPAPASVVPIPSFPPPRAASQPPTISSQSQPHDSLSAHVRVANKEKPISRTQAPAVVPSGRVSVPQQEYQELLKLRNLAKSPAFRRPQTDGDVEMQDGFEDLDEDENAEDRTLVEMDLDPRPTQSRKAQGKGKGKGEFLTRTLKISVSCSLLLQ